MPLIHHPGRPLDDLRHVAIPARRGVCVAIPARDEEERIAECLQSLLRQKTNVRFSIFVLANNCRDKTAEIVRKVGAETPLDIHLCEMNFDTSHAPAAVARRLSVNAAMDIAGSHGFVLTTDADSTADEKWIATNLTELQNGADIVCGSISPVIDEALAFPMHVMHRAAWELGIEQAQTEIEHLLDPLDWDPWPRHRMESGASLAGRVRAIVDVDSVPKVEPGEDKALVNLVLRAGGRIRHTPDARIWTSCRLDGRARGGWADDLRERVENPQALCHQSLEHSQTLFRRATLRGAMRSIWPRVDVNLWSRRLRIPPVVLRQCLQADCFEDAWHRIEAESPYLVRRRVRVEELPTENKRAARLLEFVRARVAAEAEVTDLRHRFASGELA